MHRDAYKPPPSYPSYKPTKNNQQVVVPPPDAAARLAILQSLLLLHTPDQPEPDDDHTTTTMPWLPSVARDCVGYVAADLQALVREALIATLHARSYSQAATTAAPAALSDSGAAVRVAEAALRGAMERVGASVLRGKGLEVPHVPWSAIGACIVC